MSQEVKLVNQFASMTFEHCINVQYVKITKNDMFMIVNTMCNV